MAKSRNEVYLLGRAGKDAEIRQTSTGKFVANLSVATGGGDKKDGTKYKAEWHRIVCWGSLAEACKAVATGNEVEVTGRLVYPSWTDQKGNKRSGSEIIATKLAVNGRALGDKDKDRHVSDEEVSHTAWAPPEIADDDIPF